MRVPVIRSLIAWGLFFLVANAGAATPPDQGPGGPVLVVASSANPFSEIEVNGNPWTSIAELNVQGF